MSRTPSDYPVGTPLVPPPNWTGKPVSIWRPVFAAALVTVMVLLCMMVGWLSVQGVPRRVRKPGTVEQLASKIEKPDAADLRPKEETTPVSLPPVDEEKPKPPEKPPVKVVETKKPAPPVEPVDKGKTTPPTSLPTTTPTTTPPKVVALSFQRDVRPILEKHCTSCHGATRQRGDVNLATVDGALKVVKPGMPDESPLLESILSSSMPPMKPTAVSEAERKTLREWITAGAKP